MKIVLFSDRDCLETKKVGTRLISLVGKSNFSVGYISSCPDPSRKFYDRNKQYYSEFNAALTPYIDLEEGFDRTNIELIFQADAIHLSGGNTYRFLYWLVQRGLKQRLIQYVKSGGVVIGISAGSIIMTPNIDTSRFCGDDNEIGLIDKSSLNLIDFHFVPHAIQEKLVPEKIITESDKNCSAIVIASDHDWIVIENQRCEIYGQPRLVLKGKVEDISSLNFINPQKQYQIIKN